MLRGVIATITIVVKSLVDGHCCNKAWGAEQIAGIVGQTLRKSRSQMGSRGLV